MKTFPTFRELPTFKTHSSLFHVTGFNSKLEKIQIIIFF